MLRLPLWLAAPAAVLLGVLVAGAAGAAEGSKSAAKPPPRPGVVYLEKSRGFALAPRGQTFQGILAKELFRQALLISARDELGLVTRDAWLGDAMPTASGNPPLDIVVSPRQLALVEILRGFYPVQQVIASEECDCGDSLDYKRLAVQMEEASRTRYAAVLRKAGFQGRPNAVKADAGVPETVEALLGQMTFPAQFDAVRRTHQAIRTDGESPTRLGALVRGYANLGVLTEVQWHPAHKVFKARALLYAQRMVARQERPAAWALWHRSYALALVGLPREALADLEAAEAAWKETGAPVGAGKDGPGRPAWADLIGPYCRFELDKLAPDQTEEASRQLALLLRVLAVEQSGVHSGGSHTRILQTALDGLQVMPECYRVHDTVCNFGGVGVSHSGTIAGIAAAGGGLYARVLAMPGLPKEVAAVARKARGGGEASAPLGREEPGPEDEFKTRAELTRALLASGKPDAAVPPDRGEPSWAALGRLIRELSFLQVFRRVHFERDSLAASADEFLAASAPLVADHPYRPLIESFASDGEAEKKALERLSRVPADGLEYQATPLCKALWRSHRAAWKGRNDVSVCNMDFVARDLAMLLDAFGGNPTGGARLLLLVSPYSPAARACLVEHDWKSVEAQAADWESSAGQHPAVLVALGERYAKMKRPDDAARCLRAATKIAPELNTYVTLADVYKRQGDEERWVSTLEEYLQQPDYGLSHASVCHAIARHFMNKHRWKKALHYAEEAAGTYSAWGLMCAADCHEATRSWETAEQLFKATSLRYRNLVCMWYFYCRRTGHGDLASARKLALEYVDSGKELGQEFVPHQAALVCELEGQAAKAMRIWEDDLAATASPVSGLDLALLADQAKQPRKRDAALEQIKLQGPHHRTEIARRPRMELVGLAGMIAKDLAEGGTGDIDLDAAENLCRRATTNDQQFFYYYLGKYLDLHGKPKEAIKYWKRCLAILDDRNLLPRTQAGAELIAHGLKPEEYYQELFEEPEGKANKP